MSIPGTFSFILPSSNYLTRDCVAHFLLENELERAAQQRKVGIAFGFVENAEDARVHFDVGFDLAEERIVDCWGRSH